MMNKIAICGAGWSGLLLAKKLQDTHEVTVFEQRKTLDATCAWGTPTETLKELCNEHHLNIADYLLWQSRKLYSKHFKKSAVMNMNGLCTFNKKLFMLNIASKLKNPIKYGTILKENEYQDYNLIVDATGTRAYLGTLPTDKMYVCYQELVKFDSLPYSDFYMNFKQSETTKYLWMFPLSDNVAFVGCGSLKGKDAYNEVTDFVDTYNGTTYKRYAKRLRVNPPEESSPFIVTKKSIKIVGVGNNIGAISSFGEGIDPSTATVNMLVDRIQNNNLNIYEQQVMHNLNWLKRDYQLYSQLKNGKVVSAMLNMMLNGQFYRHRFKVPLTAINSFKVK